ncbi:helix-turn-helix transcriptional regulator [Actinokineospora soli]
MRVERARISLERAAELAGWSLATLSRTENGKRHITSEDVASLLTVYKIPVAEREVLIEAAKTTGLAGWWSRPLPGVQADVGTLAAYESTANVMTNWATALVPGLLQTYAYAIGFMTADGASAEDAEMRWIARLRRQQVLPKVDYTAFIHEAVLHTAFGGRAALAEQLSHLHDVGTRGIGVRVVRHQPHAALMHSWLLIEFPSSPPIVHVELQRSTVDLHDEETEAYLRLRGMLDRIALPTAESRSMIGQLMERL